ncbi:MAG: hypothetical protein ACI32E_03760 [Bacilli bacterium]
MFKIFYDSLFRPKNIVDHVDEKSNSKFVGYLILTLLLIVLPIFLNNIFSNKLSTGENKAIVEGIKAVEPIQYKIENNKLVYTGASITPKTQQFKINSKSISLTTITFDTKALSTEYIYFVFSTIDDQGLSSIGETCYVVSLKENGVDIIFHNGTKNVQGAENLSIWGNNSSGDKIVKSLPYSSKDVNFNYTEVTDKYLFSSNIYNFFSTIYDRLDTNYIITVSVFVIANYIGNIIINMAILIVLLYAVFRIMRVSFGKIVKIAFLCFTPYVLGVVLSMCFNSNLVMIIGEIVTFIYIYRTLRNYSLLKILQENNESKGR